MTTPDPYAELDKNRLCNQFVVQKKSILMQQNRLGCKRGDRAGLVCNRTDSHAEESSCSAEEVNVKDDKLMPPSLSSLESCF